MQKNDVPVIGAYHVALFPDWKEIVIPQCQRLKKSGLWSRTDRILVGIVGSETEDTNVVRELLGDKADLRHLGPLHRYEFPTLEMLWAAARERDGWCWYLHTKAASHRTPGGVKHREQMESIIVDNFRQCMNVLPRFDAAGGFWRNDAFGRKQPHFSGNFWWATTKYLATLPSPASLNQADRYQAEFWIGANPHLRRFEFVAPEGDPLAKPSAWRGLETRFLSTLAPTRPVERIVELGVDYGFSLFQFAETFPGAEVIGVDTFPLHEDAESWVRSHLANRPNIQVFYDDPAAFGRSFSLPVDLIHIDGDHSYEGVSREFCGWIHCLRPGGCVMFHDIESFPDVRRFFDGLGGRKKEISGCHGLGFWFKDLGG